MLRPSQFAQQQQQQNNSTENNSNSGFVLKPSSLFASSSTASNSNNSTEEGSEAEKPTANPFLRSGDSVEEPDTPKQEGAATGAVIDGEQTKTSERADENSDPLTKLCSKNRLPRSNLFTVKSTISENAGFVFGQNISERVTGAKEEKGEQESDEKAEAGSSTGLLFSSTLAKSPSVVGTAAAVAATASGSGEGEGGGSQSKEVDSQSLLEAARKYEESRVQKRKFEEVETKTGEEDERNVIDINCKVFTFVGGNYEERGRGTLRLNDSKQKANESRVVFRMAGNLRVLINTKVWAGMIVETPSSKSMRMTALDAEGHVKVFLVMSRPDDITNLSSALTERINKLKSIAEQREDAVAIETATGHQNGESIPTISITSSTSSSSSSSSSPSSEEPLVKRRSLDSK